jgi:hypothetical protein
VILDVNCFIGHWPFRRIPYRTVGDIVQLMARTDTHGALMTPLAGLFYKDCLSAMREKLDELEADTQELLKVVRDRELPLMISMRVEDERLHHWLARVEPVPCPDIVWVLRAFPDIKLVLCEPVPSAASGDVPSSRY